MEADQCTAENAILNEDHQEDTKLAAYGLNSADKSSFFPITIISRALTVT
jgi:hypothetical protein